MNCLLCRHWIYVDLWCQLILDSWPVVWEVSWEAFWAGRCPVRTHCSAVEWSKRIDDHYLPGLCCQCWRRFMRGPKGWLSECGPRNLLTLLSMLQRSHLDSIAVSLSTNSIRRQDPNIYSDTETSSTPWRWLAATQSPWIARPWKESKSQVSRGQS